MKAALLEQYGKFRIEEREIRDPAAGEVQVEISHASICGTDMHIFKGDFHPRTPVPFIPGHEMAGTVAKTGTGVDGYTGGEKVAIDPIIWCGECPACKARHFPACNKLKLLGVDMDGGFCQYINVDQKMLYRAPASIPTEHLALVEIYGIGFHACRRAGVTKGDSLAIWGAGRVGQVILQAARTLTDGPVFLIDILDERLEIARNAYDNVTTINALETDPIPAILDKTDGMGCDIAFEAIGHALHADRIINPVRGAINSIRGAGIVCVLGLTDEPAPVVFKELIWKEAKIISSRVSHGEYPMVLEKLAGNQLRPEILISDVLPVERIQEAFETIEKHPGKHLKIVLKF